jgi:hypothetical protein
MSDADVLSLRETKRPLVRNASKIFCVSLFDPTWTGDVPANSATLKALIFHLCEYPLLPMELLPIGMKNHVVGRGTTGAPINVKAPWSTIFEI